ncbi:LOW QUALITY PROTEIN: cyclin-dependent kinase 20-like [Anomalospiza imberbis]|uniref:LOW QUALITY PROTEIN: cyclin-dependent kinase 20-like n=1 Tax=Anomalospiza imberbis TaxID=187417 RepID=UPI00358FADEC
MDQYIVLGRIGEGAHGVVFKAKHRETGELVALKKVPLRRPEDGVPPQTLREIKALREIEAHPHVIRLRAAFAQGPAVVLALELLVGDLGGLLRAAPAPLPPPRVRALLAMTLRGLGHVHGQRLLHRVSPQKREWGPQNGSGDTKNGIRDLKNESGDIKNGSGDTKNGIRDLKNESGDIKNGSGDTKNGSGDTKNGNGDTKNESGDIKNGMGTPKMGFGTPKMRLGTPKMGLGTPKQEWGHQKRDWGHQKWDTPAAPPTPHGHPKIRAGGGSYSSRTPQNRGGHLGGPQYPRGGAAGVGGTPKSRGAPQCLGGDPQSGDVAGLGDTAEVPRVLGAPLTPFLGCRTSKPANLLLDSAGRLKLADFGLARVLGPAPGRPYSHQVATRWYRAPELLYGARHYDEGVDLWAVGCIFGELLTLSPLFPGENDIEQLCCVLRALGTPSPRDWPELSELPDFPKLRFRPRAPPPLQLLVPGADAAALDLLQRLLRYRPHLRPRAHQALLHPFFFGPQELTPPPPAGGSRQPPDFSLDTALELPPRRALGPLLKLGDPWGTPTDPPPQGLGPLPKLGDPH